MRKFVLFIIISLFYCTHAFAQTLVFDRCWNVEEYKSFNDVVKDKESENRTYEVNLDQDTVVEIIIYHDELVQKSADAGYALPKIDAESYPIKVVTKEYISTHPEEVITRFGNSGVYRSFVIKTNGEVETLSTGNLNVNVKYKCDKISGTKSDTGSSGAKGFLKKLLGNN